MNSQRLVVRKRSDLDSWNVSTFFRAENDIIEQTLCKDSPSFQSQITSVMENVFIEESQIPSRKHILAITMESLTKRLAILLEHITFIAGRESVDPKRIASMTLEIFANRDYDRKTSEICKEIISTGNYAPSSCILNFDKAAALIDILEIGKRKYTELQLLCKPEGFIIPTYKKISSYSHQLVLSTDIEIVKQTNGYPVGAAINYSKIISKTTERIVEIIGPIDAIHYPLTVHVADGLDGPGSHKVYNQIHTNIDFLTKCFILFAFKILKVISIKSGLMD